MKSVINMDSPFFRTAGRIGDIFLLNLMFVVSCIPVITAGAAVTALMTVEIKMAADQDDYIVKGYWRAFRSNFLKSTALHLIMCALGALLLFDFLFWRGQQGLAAMVFLGVSVVFLLIYLMELFYVYVQQAVFENTVAGIMKGALFMAVKHLPTTLLLFAVHAALIYMMLTFVALDIFMLLFGFGLLGYGTGVLYRAAYREYLDKAEEERKRRIEAESVIGDNDADEAGSVIRAE